MIRRTYIPTVDGEPVCDENRQLNLTVKDFRAGEFVADMLLVSIGGDRYAMAASMDKIWRFFEWSPSEYQDFVWALMDVKTEEDLDKVLENFVPDWFLARDFDPIIS